MLDLLKTFTGSPSGPLQHLVLPHATLIVRARFSSVTHTFHARSSCTRLPMQSSFSMQPVYSWSVSLPFRRYFPACRV